MLCLEVILSHCFFAMQPQFAMEKFYSILVLEPLYVICFSIVETVSVFFFFFFLVHVVLKFHSEKLLYILFLPHLLC